MIILRVVNLVWLALLAGLYSVAIAAEGPVAYAVSVPIKTEPPPQGLYRVALPVTVLHHLRSIDRRDLRVFNAAGEPVPFAWVGTPVAGASAPRRIELPRFVWPVPSGAVGEADVRVELRSDGAVVRVEQRSGSTPRSLPGTGSTQWLLDLSVLGDERPQALELRWAAEAAAAQGVVRVASVFVSADAKRWRSAGEGTVFELRDATGTSLRQPRIELQGLERTDRYLRLQFATPLAVQGVQAEMPAAAPALALDSERLRPLRSGPRSWTLDSGALLPVRRMQVHVTEDNSVLPLTIARRRPATPPGDTADDWVVAATHTAYRMVREGVTVSSPPLELDGVGAREWRLTLDERVGSVDRGPEVTLWWPAVQLVFAARGAGPFTLALGRSGVAAADIELRVLIPGYREGDEFKLPAATLGVPTVRPTAVPSLAERLSGAEPGQRRQWALWATLLIAVVVLALLALRLGRDLRDSARKPPEP